MTAGAGDRPATTTPITGKSVGQWPPLSLNDSGTKGVHGAVCTRSSGEVLRKGLKAAAQGSRFLMGVSGHECLCLQKKLFLSESLGCLRGHNVL